jgi:hypothetical protein
LNSLGTDSPIDVSLSDAESGIMSDLLGQDAILSETMLKACSNCGHQRGMHPNDKGCKTEDCKCKAFGK